MAFHQFKKCEKEDHYDDLMMMMMTTTKMKGERRERDTKQTWVTAVRKEDNRREDFK